MEMIKILRQKKIEHQNWEANEYAIIPPIPLTSFKEWISADPGTTNMGLARLYSIDERDCATLWQIKIAREDNMLDRLTTANWIVQTCFNLPSHSYRMECPILVIEGASYGNNFRQVELAEQRAAIALWGFNKLQTIMVIPPLTIRETVFGFGKIKAHEAWQLEGIPKSKQPNDALAALSCAYYGMMKESEQ